MLESFIYCLRVVPDVSAVSRIKCSYIIKSTLFCIKKADFYLCTLIFLHHVHRNNSPLFRSIHFHLFLPSVQLLNNSLVQHAVSLLTLLRLFLLFPFFGTILPKSPPFPAFPWKLVSHSTKSIHNPSSVHLLAPSPSFYPVFFLNNSIPPFLNNPLSHLFFTPLCLHRPLRDRLCPGALPTPPVKSNHSVLLRITYCPCSCKSLQHELKYKKHSSEFVAEGIWCSYDFHLFLPPPQRFKKVPRDDALFYNIIYTLLFTKKNKT